MLPDDRSIHFSTELMFKPRKFTKQELQKFYFDLTQVSGLNYDNSQFGGQALAQFYTKTPPKTQSMLIVLPDRVALLEEWAAIPLTDFNAKVKSVAEEVLELGVEGFTAQTVTLRSTFSPVHSDNSCQFILERICQQGSLPGQHFARPIGVGGIRFALPETPEHPGSITVSIESFHQDPREILVDLKAAYRNLQIAQDSLDELTTTIIACRSFMQDRIRPYLETFDHAPSGEL
jgi:hypothetical protein